MARGITLSVLKDLSHVDITDLRGRQVHLCPVWEGNKWKHWLPLEDGTLAELSPVDIEGPYLTKGDSAGKYDLHFPFINYVIQQWSFPQVRGLIDAVEDDFHLLAVRAAKLEHFFSQRDVIDQRLLASFVRSEIEGIIVTSRSVLDLSYEIFMYVWNERVSLLDPDLSALKKGNKLPKSLSKLLYFGGAKSSVDSISDKYAIPKSIAQILVNQIGFFEDIRKLRTEIVHGTSSKSHVYVTDRSFAVSPKEKPFDEFDWKDFH